MTACPLSGFSYYSEFPDSAPDLNNSNKIK